MQNKLLNLLAVIDDAIERADYPLALQLVMTNWYNLPDPSLLRERVAQMLASVGRKREAVEILELAARHYANAGYPTRSLAAIKQLDALRPGETELFDHFTELYNIRSPHTDNDRLQQDFPQPAGNLSLQVSVSNNDQEMLLDRAAERALDSEGVANEPGVLPPLPLLSLLPAEALRRILDYLEYELFAEPEPVLMAGETEPDLIWTASSDLLVENEDKETFRLPAGALLGLNAFGQSATPPAQTVMCRKGSELLRLSAESIEILSEEFSDFPNRLATLRRHALTEGLLCRHPAFAGLDDEDRVDVANHFTGLRVPKGEFLIFQDAPSPGIFIILDGNVDIIRKDDTWEITIAALSAGDVFGEVGLVSDKPAIASVTTTTPGHLLFMSRRNFEAVVQKHPVIARYAVQLAGERIADVEQTLSGRDVAEVD
ncbi:MAG: cyclic nucleotide-binding domain-containing protein [Bradymonadaceae bacterium]